MIPKVPKVLQVLPALNQGGVENTTVDLTKAILDKFPGYPTYIASQGGSLLEDRLLKEESRGFHHFFLPLHLKSPWAIIKNAIILRKLIQKYRIDIVHGRSRAPAWAAWLATRLSPAVFMTTFHGTYKSNFPLKKLLNSVMARGEVVVVHSRFIQNHVKKRYPWANTLYIQGGIDMRFYKAQHSALTLKSKEEKWIFLPSRLSPIKGIHIAIKALAEVVKDYPHVHLTLIQSTGRDVYLKEIDNLIAHHRLENHVHFIAPTPDLRPYYEKSLIVLMPSLVPETLGRVSLEALSMERLLIGTDLGATKEICIHGKTGFLVPPGDVENLKNAILEGFRLEDEALSLMTRAGRSHVARSFDKNKTTKKMIDLYEKLL